MFSDSVTEVTSFYSCPESEKSVNDNSSQTVDIHTSTQSTQTIGSSSSAVQVAPDATEPSHPYDADKLLKFLNRVMPHLEDELRFSQDLNFPKDTDEDEKATEQTPKQIIIKPDFSKGKVISSLSWNSTRMMLAVGCSEETHDGWCCHETSVGVYNTGKTHFEKQPEQVLRVPSCVRCLVFHWTIPSLLAGGLHSGEVIIWDLKHDEEVFTVNKKGTDDEPAHADTITTVTWREDESGLRLVTAGRDGRIVLWKVSLTNLTFEVCERYLIRKQNLMPGTTLTEHLDIQQIEFLSTKGSSFLTATTGGVIFYCSLTTARSLSALPYKDPVEKYFKPRSGIVTSISCGPKLFASGGTDFEIQIFNYEQTPMLKIPVSYAVLGVWWHSPKSLISWGKSKVSLHVLNSGKVVPICDAEGISSAAFERGRTRARLAVGDTTGAVRIVTNWAN